MGADQCERQLGAILFLLTPEAKDRLIPALAPANVSKNLALGRGKRRLSDKNCASEDQVLGICDIFRPHPEAKMEIPAQVAFRGFSQGACLATEFVGRNPQRYAGLLAFTGGLIGPLNVPISLSGDLSGTPVLLSSGDPDPHVPWERVAQSAELLTGIGPTVSLKRYPGRPHTILPDEVEDRKKLLSLSLHQEGSRK